MPNLTLFQFELCPFCHKVKLGLALKHLAFDTVEVNPMNKKELPDLPPDMLRKVPVIAYQGDVVQDSTRILKYLDERFDQGLRFIPRDEAAAKKAVEVEDWVDAEFAKALPTVIYGTWGEALKAAQVTARTSNFGFVQNLGVRAGGPLIMHQVAKRILKKRGKSDGHAWVDECMATFEGHLGEAPFSGGEQPDLADVGMHGVMSCVRDFPIFASMMQRPRIQAWYQRVQELADLGTAASLELAKSA
jgi:glutathione S-transferase